MTEKDAFEGSRITGINQMPYSQEMVEAFINICTVKVVDVRLIEKRNDDIETIEAQILYLFMLFKQSMLTKQIW